MFIFDKIVTDIIYILILLNRSSIGIKTNILFIWKNFFRENFKLLFKPKIFIRNQKLLSTFHKKIFKKIGNKLHKFTLTCTDFFFYEKIKIKYIQRNILKKFTWSLFKKENNSNCINLSRNVKFFFIIRIICYFCSNEIHLTEIADYSSLFFTNPIRKITSNYFCKNFITFNHFCVYCRVKRKMNRTIRMKFCFDVNCRDLCYIFSLFTFQPFFYVNNIVERNDYFFNLLVTCKNKINSTLKNSSKMKISTFSSFLIKANICLKINFFFLIKAVSNNIMSLMIFLKQFKKKLKEFQFKKSTKVPTLQLYNKYMNKFFFENCKKLDNYIDFCDHM